MTDLDFAALDALPVDEVARILLSRRPRRVAPAARRVPPTDDPRSPISEPSERALVPATPDVARATPRVARPAARPTWLPCPECGRLATTKRDGSARTCAPCSDSERGAPTISGEIRPGRCTEHRDRPAVATVRIGSDAWRVCRECAESAERLRGNPSGGYDAAGGSTR